MRRNRQGSIIAWFLCVFLLAGCSNTSPKSDATAENTPLAQASAPIENAQKEETGVSDLLVGFILPDAADITLQTSMHGFLRTAENLGYPAKIYTAEEGASAADAVELAVQEGCAGLLIWNKGKGNAEAVARASELGLPVVIPYYSKEGTQANANVLADLTGYAEEAALGIAERMVERELKSGKILIYGTAPAQLYEMFTKAIAAYYPQYNVGYFARTTNLEQAAIDELAAYILANRDVKGMYCTDVGGAAIAVKAREKAIADFKSGDSAAPANTNAGSTPNPENRASHAPGATPVPEGLLKSITITVFGYGLDDESVALLQRNDIQAFVAEPYYEASAQSLMLLDRILKGESVPEVTKLNMPIVRQATLDKYLVIREQTLDWFSPKS